MADRPKTESAQAADLQLDLHVLPLGKKKGDESFVDGFRRKGPEGLTREVVVIEVDEKGVGKVAEKVRQLLDRKLTAFVVNLAGVPTIEGTAVKELVRARSLAAEKGGYLALAGAKDAVAGLLNVTAKEIPAHGSLDQAIDGVKSFLQTEIEKKGGLSQRSMAGGASDKFAKTGEIRAVRPEGRLAFEESGDELLFYPAGKKPSKKDMAGDTPVLTFMVDESNMRTLAEEVKKAAASGTNRVIADVSDLAPLDADGRAALAAASQAAKEKKTRLVFAGIESGAEKGLETFESDTAAAEQLAVELLEEKQKKGVKLKRVRGQLKGAGRTQMVAAPKFDDEEADERRPAKTAQFAAPKFDEDEEDDEEKPRKTGVFSAPKFDEDDESKEERKPGKTGVFSAPKFEEKDEVEERRPAKTAQFAAPKFDEDDEDEDEKPRKTGVFSAPKFEEADEDEEPRPSKTAQFAAPKFDEDEEDDEEEKKPPKTQVFSAPKFDDETAEEKKPGKTQMISSPNFDEDDESKDAKGGAKSAKAGKTDPERPAAKVEAKSKTEPERPALKVEPKAKTDPQRPAATPAGEDMRAAKTQAMTGLSRDEALRLAAEAAGKPMPAPVAAPKPAAPAPAPAPKAAPAPAPDVRMMKTEAMTGLSREEALRLAAEATGKPAPAAAAKPAPAPAPKPAPAPAAAPAQDVRMMKTEAMPGLSKEEALRLAAQAAGKPAPAPAAKPDLKSARTEMMQAMPADPKGAKTEFMQAAKATGEMKAAKTEFMQAAKPPADDLKVAKTEMMQGLSKEEAMRLAAEAAGKPAPKPGPVGGAKTEVFKAPPAEPAAPQRTAEMKAAPAEDLKVAKTEMMQGLSREEAMKLAKEATGKQTAPQKGAPAKTEVFKAAAPAPTAPQKTEMFKAPPAEPAAPQKTSEMKGFDPKAAEANLGKTAAMPGLSREEAMKLAAQASGKAPTRPSGEKAVPPKTEQLKAFDPKAGGAAPPKTEQVKAFDPGSEKKSDQQTLKTEALPGLSRADAEKMVKSGKAAGADFQEVQTGSMPGLDKGSAKKEFEKIELQSAKTQAIDGLSKEDAERELKTERDIQIEKPEGWSGAERAPEATAKRSPMMMVGAFVAVLLIAVVAFLLTSKGPTPTAAAKLNPVEMDKLRAALVDASMFDDGAGGR